MSLWLQVKLIKYKLQWLEVKANSDGYKDAKAHYLGLKEVCTISSEHFTQADLWVALFNWGNQEP